MKYYIIAGEASGDLHGSNLMKAIKAKDSEAEFRFWGGDNMKAQGGFLVKHIKELAFMGFIEVLFNLRTILGNLRLCKADIDRYKPDSIIFIDYPGFNLRIAEFAREKGYKTIYYISPQIWAWKQSRVHKIKRDVDLMLCILPFEKDFYSRFDYEVEFVGHPLIDAIEGREAVNAETKRKELSLSEKPIILLMPGSRKQEISTMLPVMLEGVKEFADYELVIAGAPAQDKEFYESITHGTVKVISGVTYDLLEICEAAVVTSGTATLETAMFKVPQVVCYKGNWISYFIARQLVKVKYISLVNLIMDRTMVKELIQADMNPGLIRQGLKKCLSVENQAAFQKGYEELYTKLGGAGASLRAAEIIVNHTS